MKTRRVAILLAATLIAAHAFAQEYPAKPVRLIVPFAAGGPNELAARPVAAKLQEVFGQPFVIDYRTGANGMIGSEYVAKAPPDGYTLLVISSSYTINAAISKSLPFDPVRDLVAVSSIATSNILLVVNPTVPAHSLKEFVALAKAHPGKLTYGSSGTGGSLHLGGVLLSLHAGIQMLHVPYKGASLALTDVMGGHVDSMFIAASAALPQIKGGRVRALAVASPHRAAALPEVPTAAEAGFPGVEVESRYGVLAPAAIPRDLLTRLNAGIVKVLNDAELRERYAVQGLEAAPSTPQEYGAYLRDDIAKWRKVATAAKLPMQ